MKLLDDVVPIDKQHAIYRLIKHERYAPERAVLMEWADGFVDRDGKFCHEFQTTFEPCLWELYLYTCLRHFGATIDFSVPAPDFVASAAQDFSVEATIAAPRAGAASRRSAMARRIFLTTSTPQLRGDLAASRPIMSALYGLYHDEQLTIATSSTTVISYNVNGVRKSEAANVPIGYFLDDSYSDVSAVVRA